MAGSQFLRLWEAKFQGWVLSDELSCIILYLQYILPQKHLIIFIELN